MELAGVDLNLLVALDLLLTTRSVREAARRAHVTPSAMSHTLGRLRALLDDDVLVRSGHRMVATPRAQALGGPVRAWLDGAAALLARPTAFEPASLRRRFRLVCTDHISTILLPQIEALLRAEAPGVDLCELPPVADVVGQLRSGEVDAAIGVFPDPPPEVRMRRLFTDSFVTVARHGHPRVGSGPISLEAWLAESHLLVAPRGSPTGTVDEHLATLGLQRRVARTVPQFLSALWRVAESDLLLTVSRRLVAATAHRIPLAVFAPPIELPDYALVLAFHPRVEQAPEDQWFRGVLVRAADALDP